jgi:hypothetical protein
MRSLETAVAKTRALRRGKNRRWLMAELALAAVLAAGGAYGHAQQSQQLPLGASAGIRGFPQDNGPFSSGGDAVDSVEAERRLKALNADRQKSLVSDTAKLLKLATELNEQIAKSNTGELSPEQLRMVAEIEKLAHNVRDKMAMSLRGPQFPGLDSPMQPFPQGTHH